jgi:hypothetical protein
VRGIRRRRGSALCEAIGGSPEQLGKLARSDSEKYQRLVKELNISAG